MSFPAYAKYSGGTGEPNDPYQIATAEDLMLVGETPEDYDKHFILTADIDLDPNLPGRKVFDKAVIAPFKSMDGGGSKLTAFTGVFKGNGHTISHLTIIGGSFLGLFGGLAPGSEVRDLCVTDVNITGSRGSVGGIVGSNSFGAVVKCYSTGKVSGSSSVGGLVGWNDGGIVTQCYSSGSVSGTENVGGLVGFNDNGSNVSNCYSTSTVSGDEGVGGLVGRGHYPDEWMISVPPGVVERCYCTGSVSGNSNVGGLVGGVSGWGIELADFVIACFWDTQNSGQSTSDGGTGKTTTEMHDIQTYQDAGWDFWGVDADGLHEVWQMPEEGGYPVLATFNGYTPPKLQGMGTVEDPYLISNALELGAIVRYSSYAHYRLTDSIDLSGICWGTSVVPQFAGTFDGNGHTISHLTINGWDYSFVYSLGLFGQLQPGAELRNLGVVDVNISGSDRNIGGLVGINGGGTVTNCHSTGLVCGEGSWSGGTGGLVGANWGSITKSCSTCTVSGNCPVGGLLGGNWGLINQCYSDGAVIGEFAVGGLAGSNGRRITNCYSTSTVVGANSIGGLVGENWLTYPGRGEGSGYVTECYSTGLVSGTGENVGGLVGFNQDHGDDKGVVSQSFWDNQTSGQVTSAGGTGKTTAEMQTAQMFLDAGWDFVGETTNGTDDIWKIVEGQTHPLLSWQKYSGGTGEPNDPYQIATAEDLMLLGETPEDYNKHFILTADIDLDPNLSGRRVFGKALIAADTGSASHFQGTPFTGVFDGNDHTISNMTIEGGWYLGLFGMLGSEAEIKSLGVIDVNIVGSGYYVGALVGMDYYGNVTDCYSTGEVSGTGWDVGGLVGANCGEVTNCYSASKVRGDDSVGGLVGANQVWYDWIQRELYVGFVTRSYSIGTVSGEEAVGGLVGVSCGRITNCYSMSAVTGGTSVGGLVGANGIAWFNVGVVDVADGLVAQCYSTGAVRGDSYVGGLIGTGRGSHDVIATGIALHSVWDMETSGLSGSNGGVGLTTAEMQTVNTFLEAGWDFVNETTNGTDDIWWILEGKDYPRLWWELISEN